MSIPRFNLETVYEGLKGEETKMVEHPFGMYVQWMIRLDILERT